MQVMQGYDNAKQASQTLQVVSLRETKAQPAML